MHSRLSLEVSSGIHCTQCNSAVHDACGEAAATQESVVRQAAASGCGLTRQASLGGAGLLPAVDASAALRVGMEAEGAEANAFVCTFYAVLTPLQVPESRNCCQLCLVSSCLRGDVAARADSVPAMEPVMTRCRVAVDVYGRGCVCWCIRSWLPALVVAQGQLRRSRANKPQTCPSCPWPTGQPHPSFHMCHPAYECLSILSFYRQRAWRWRLSPPTRTRRRSPRHWPAAAAAGGAMKRDYTWQDERAPLDC